MNSVKIVHCADLHLGSAFAGLKRKGAERRKDLYAAFKRIIRICKQEQADFLLIAGDLFDGLGVPTELLVAVRDGFASIPDTIVAIAPGNHDPRSVDSFYTSGNSWPDNVVIFPRKFTCYTFPGRGVKLWGAAFSGAYCEQPLLEGVAARDDSMLNICVLHGELVSEGQASRYNGVTARQIGESGMDYIALGHIHKRTKVQRVGRTFYANPGCPEGRGFDETGRKGVYVGTVARDRCSLRFLPVNRRTYIEMEVDVAGRERAEIGGVIREALETRHGPNYRENLYKISLTGAVNGETWLDQETVSAELSDVFYVRLYDRTEVEEPMGDGYTLRSIFARRMAVRMEEEDDPVLHLALKLGLRAFTGRVDYYED